MFRLVLKGGKGSGHRGHAGRPGIVGGSLPGISGGKGMWESRTDTIPVKTLKGNTIYVDRGIAPLVEKLNNAKLETAQSCSGHTCNKPIETYISFRHIRASQETYDAIRDIVESDKLNMNWVLRDKPMNWHELYPKLGFYGAGTLKSTIGNLKAIDIDMQAIIDVIEE